MQEAAQEERKNTCYIFLNIRFSWKSSNLINWLLCFGSQMFPITSLVPHLEWYTFKIQFKGLNLNVEIKVIHIS